MGFFFRRLEQLLQRAKAIMLGLGSFIFFKSFTEGIVDYFKGRTEIPFVILHGVLFGLMFWGFYRVMLVDKCPKCKKTLALEHMDTETIGVQKISVLKETKRYDRDRNVIGSQEQYIPGRRIKYRLRYVCRYCGEEVYKYQSQDSADI